MTRCSYATVTSFAVIGLVATAFLSVPTAVIWNASASVPIGLYLVKPVRHLAVADLVAVKPPERLADLMVERGYIGRGVLLLKRIKALSGQKLCRIGSTITVDAVPLGDALDYDRRGRELPVWQGCRVLADGEVFLMNSGVRDSFDGRYFGPVAAQAVVGRAVPIYTDESGDGRFVVASDDTRTANRSANIALADFSSNRP